MNPYESRYVSLFGRRFSVILMPLVLVLFASACSYTTPPVVTPVPSDEVVDKTFFRKRANVTFLIDPETGNRMTAEEAAMNDTTSHLLLAGKSGQYVLTTAAEKSGWQIVVEEADVPKTFVCGWAPISEVGFISEWTQVHGAPTLPACNLQFEIEETKLVGRQVIPNVPRKDWPTIITIPVNSHFDLVNKEDKYGRPLTETYRRTDRHTWDFRASMSLNWRGIEINDWAYQLLYGGTLTTSVKDVVRETYKGKSYIAFTSAVTSGYFGAYHQAQFRINFLEFESDPSFEKRVYHQDNSQHFGTLWGLGAHVNGDHPVKYIGRWDFRPEALPHEICLNGFEGSPEAKAIAVETLDLWNKALQEADVVPNGVQAFVPSKRNMDYTFDLRCSSISYVSDKRISSRSPLGIAFAQMDVRNGKILWAGSMNYGGALEGWIEYYKGSNFGSAGGSGDSFMTMPGEAVFSQEYGRPIYNGNPFANMMSPLDNFSLGAPSSRINVNDVESTIATLYRGMNFVERRGSDEWIEDFAKRLEGAEFSDIEQMAADGRLAELGKKVYAANGGMNPTDGRISWEEMGAYVAHTLRVAKGEGVLSADDFLNSESSFIFGGAVDSLAMEVDNVIGGSNNLMSGSSWQSMLVGTNTFMEDQLMRSAIMGNDYHQRSPELQAERIAQNAEYNLARMRMTGIQDLDNTIGRFAEQVATARGELGDLDVEDIVLTSIRKTMLHEFGHMLGLGHNFRDNIMPERGSIPDAHWTKLEEDRKILPKVNLNFTTVMGYPHAFQVMARHKDEVNVGPQDKLVLRYIYNNQVPIFNPNSPDEDFKYLTLGQDIPGQSGRIPDVKTDLGRYNSKYDGYKVTYFPSCTDMMAIFALDPYCNRWDLGYDAKTIVEGYFDDYQNNWLTKLNNFAKLRNDLWMVRYRLWTGSLYTFSRVRAFYDYMRRKYRREILEIAESDPKNLLSFSKCANDDQENSVVRGVIQKSDPEFEMLCNLNREAIQRLSVFTTDPGKDFAVFDDDDWSVPSNELGHHGFADWSKIWGTWREIGVLPIKTSALYTITTAKSYWTYGPHIIDNYKYAKSGVNNKYTYASLYPYEFTQAITDSVMRNIKLNTVDAVEPEMGRIATFMGVFLSQTFGWPFHSTNDFHEFDGEYMDDIRQQSRFIFNPEYPFVPIFVRVKRPNGGSKDIEMVSDFTAFIYEWGKEIKELGSAYMLPEGKVFFGTTPQTIVYPVTDLIFLSSNIALVWGIRTQYDTSDYSTLSVNGIKEALFEQYEDVVTNCTEVAGLSRWFSASNKEFPGFYLPLGIEGNSSRYKLFKKSVKEQFAKYQQNPEYAEKSTMCTKGLDDIGLIMTQALALNNIFLPMITRYMVH